MKKSVKSMSMNMTISSWLIALSILMVAYDKIFDQGALWMLFCTGLAVLSMGFAIITISREKIAGLLKYVYVIIGLWLWCMLLAFLQDAEKPLRFEVLERLIYTGMITYVFCNFRIPLNPLKISFYLILAFLYYNYFKIGVETVGINDHESGAINTVIMLSVAIPIQVLDYLNNQRISILPALLILPISIVSWNRTGFIVSILYVLIVFFVGSGMVRKRGRRYVLYGVLTILLIIIVVSFYDFFAESTMFSKFEDQGLDNSIRSTIWASYFSTFDLAQLIVGRAIDNSHPLVMGFINPHNSFIMLHSQTGLFAFFFVFVMIKRLCVYFKSNKFVAFLFLVLIIRSFFDMVFFFQPFDYAFYLFMINYKKLSVKQQNIEIKLI